MPEKVAPTESGSSRGARDRHQIRRALTVAALDLFVTQGYEATTVDQIAATAGVGRRTFFRYFGSKEDVVFPDHERRLAEVEKCLNDAGKHESALSVVNRTAEVVLEMYTTEPEVSRKRFELVRRVPSLRDKEIASIDGYQRVFTRFLRQRFGNAEGGALRATVTAAAVVAAHNHVLREWLRGECAVEAHTLLRSALSQVRHTMENPPVEASARARTEEVVVAIVRTSAPAEEVLDQIKGALQEVPAN